MTERRAQIIGRAGKACGLRQTGDAVEIGIVAERREARADFGIAADAGNVSGGVLDRHGR